MIALFLVCLAAFTIASVIQEPPPKFGPFCGTPSPVYNNGTKATNWGDYIAEIETLNEDGSTDTWGAYGGPIPWPRTSEHEVVIPYCFTQAWDRRHIRNVVATGMAKWVEYLGGPASQTSGHAISFRERADAQGNPMYCAPPDNRDGWTAGMPKDTVAFEYTEDQSWGGSVGLTRNGRFWQQLVHIADGYTLLGAMHELGHVLGMAHEHNRSDRDIYIQVNHKHLADWDKCWRRAHQHGGPYITPDNLCQSIHLAINYGCSCAAFVKNFVEPGWPIKADSRYDLDSIMHYPSQTGYSNQKCISTGQDCPLAVYRNWNDHSQGTRLLEQARRPSEMDLLWVKRTYPWKLES
ncbi:zincin [Curvularia clavata]|uniref:Zincin n=1 Tax=Curvularia clavata TaxID=95742 RepID=A0A9Q8Z0C3_CURCL|nr:zincin [Curvularia clavata]